MGFPSCHLLCVISLTVLWKITFLLCVFVWECMCVHISAGAHFCYKYHRWLTVSSVWLWQLLFVALNRLLVNGWRFEVPCLSLCDGCRAVLSSGYQLMVPLFQHLATESVCASYRPFLWMVMSLRVMGRLNMVDYWTLLLLLYFCVLIPKYIVYLRGCYKLMGYCTITDV